MPLSRLLRTPGALSAITIAALVAVSLVAIAACAAPARTLVSNPADLVVTNARIWTGDASRPQAQALAVRDGRLVAVGSDLDALALVGPATRRVDAGGRRVVPGLNDSHLHVTRGGRFYAAELRWDGVPSLALGLARVSEQARRTPPGQWVRVVGGWSPFQFAERRLPTPAELTAAAPDTPVFVLFLYSRGFLNAAGVQALGITADTPAPPGTRIELTPDGGAVLHAEPNPTLLYQTIGRLPALSQQDQALSTRHFYHELSRFGLTSAVDAGGGGHQFPGDYAGSAALAASGEMPLRVSYFLFPQTPGREGNQLRAWTASLTPGVNRALHLDHGYELDGAGENLVWAAGDYENFLWDRPEIGGIDSLTSAVRLLVSRGWPLRIHATYDESARRFLDVFEAVDRGERAAGRPGMGTDRPDGARDGARWAFDHLETASPATLQRVRALGGGVAV